MSARLSIRRPRYADVAATLALVFAMSGTAYAVSTVVDPNSVDTAAIQALAVTNPKIANEAVSASKIEPGAVIAGKIAAAAVTHDKIGAAAVGAGNLANGSVTHAKIAGNSVTGGDVLNHSLSLADLAGANVTGPVSFSFAAHGCGYLVFSVSGARVGQAAIMTWVGTTNPPAGVVVGPLKVVKTGRVVASACNMTGHRVSASRVTVRVTTFG